MPDRAKGKIRWLPLTALVLAGAAGAALRYTILERRAPRTFSYSIESCFRFRYAEMRMLGRPVPPLDLLAQWPEGFEVDKTILSLPDRTAALAYRLRGGGDPFLIAVLASLNLVFAVVRSVQPAAQVGGALWTGLVAAAVANEPLWAKGTLWNVSAALALAPAAGYLLARYLRRIDQARRFTVGAAAVLLGAAVLFNPSQDYGHVFALLWAKATNLGVKPEPSRLSFDARLYWVGPYNSPGRPNFVLEYGLPGLFALSGFRFSLPRPSQTPTRFHWDNPSGVGSAGICVALPDPRAYDHISCPLGRNVVHLSRCACAEAKGPRGLAAGSRARMARTAEWH